MEKKLRFDLIPPNGLTEVAKAFTIGCKHDEGDKPGYLQKPKPARHHIAALLRHLYAHLRGEERDPEGQLHMASVAARALILLEMRSSRRPARLSRRAKV